jgi:hypothetical protein
MSGTYRHLAPGRYQLVVDAGQGPAGVRRSDGGDIIVGVEGGRQSFSIPRDERVYYWWRGPTPRQGVRLASAAPPVERALAEARSG